MVGLPSTLPFMRLWRVEIFPHEGTIFLAVSEQLRLVTCIKEGLRGNARLGPPLHTLLIAASFHVL